MVVGYHHFRKPPYIMFFHTKERTLDAMVKSGCTIVRSNTFAYNALLRHYAQEGQARQGFCWLLGCECLTSKLA